MENEILLIAGGSYAPPHIGHLNTWISAADKVLEENPESKIKILVCPVGDIYDKASIKMFNYDKRVSLLKKLISTQSRYTIEISDINKDIQHDTDKEVSIIEKKYGNKPFVIFGADNMLGALNQEKGGWELSNEALDRLLKNNTFVVSCSREENDPRGSCRSVEDMFNEKKAELEITSTLYTFEVDRKFSEMSSSGIIKSLKLLDSSIKYAIPDIFTLININTVGGSYKSITKRAKKTKKRKQIKKNKTQKRK